MGNQAYLTKIGKAAEEELRRGVYQASAERMVQKDEEEQNEEQEEEGQTQYTFSSDSFSTFLITAYVIQQFIKEHKTINISSENTSEFEYSYEKYTEVLTLGVQVFEYNDFLIVYTTDQRSMKNVIRSNEPIKELLSILKHKLKWENPLRGKFMQILEYQGTPVPVLKATPKTTFKEVILDAKMKEDIYDNTIFQLEHLNENNGIILYGDPGVGKSLICSAITNEANKKGISVCYLTTQTDYSVLGEFIEEFIAPCVVIFEDIDSFAENREQLNGSNLSDFLQFINGIGEREDKVIFVATTNYLDKLDKAIANRPMRFNRKFKFDFPTPDELKELVSLYFSTEIAEKYYTLYTHKRLNFSGAHIKEMSRTAKLLEKKTNQSIDTLFPEAFELVKKNFSTNLKPSVGFGQDD